MLIRHDHLEPSDKGNKKCWMDDVLGKCPFPWSLYKVDGEYIIFFDKRNKYHRWHKSNLQLVSVCLENE